MQTLYQLQMFSLHVAWISVGAGMVTGAISGLLFFRENWLGGYGSHPRRLLRLGHISLFGLGFLNLAFAGTAAIVPFSGKIAWSIALSLAAGTVLMPTCCVLCAWRKRLGVLFPLPVSLLLAAVTLVLRNWPAL